MNSKKVKRSNKQKDWRKNIDVTLEEKTRLKKMNKKLDENETKVTKPQNLFSYDTTKEELPKGFIKNNRKIGEKDQHLENNGYNKLLNRKVKHFTNLDVKTLKADDKKIKNEKIYDIWGDKPTVTKAVKSILSFPRVKLPHPGLSYNPSGVDSKNLINTVVNLNKGVLIEKNVDEEFKNKFTTIPLSEKREEISDDSESETDSESDSESNSESERNENSEKLPKVANPLTRRQRTKIRNAKENQLKSEHDKKLKIVKKDIFEIKSTKKFERLQNLNKEEIAEKNKILKQENKNREILKSQGAIFEKDLIINLPNNRPLKNVNKEDYTREIFNDILKSGSLGEFSKETKRNDRHNKKKNKYVHREKRGIGDYEICVEDKQLNIYE